MVFIHSHNLSCPDRLDTVSALEVGTDWTVMVEDVNPSDGSFSSETSENLDPTNNYVFSLVTVETEGVDGGSDDFILNGPESTPTPGKPHVYILFSLVCMYKIILFEKVRSYFKLHPIFFCALYTGIKYV